jgi:hypothetical protein
MENLNERVLVNFRIPLGLKQRLEKAAKGRGRSLTGFAIEAFQLAANVDPSFWSTITDIAEIHGLSEARVIQNIVLRYLAEQLALDEVYGPDAPRLPTEFTKTQKGQTLTGIDLIERLKAEFVQEFRKRRDRETG